MAPGCVPRSLAVDVVQTGIHRPARPAATDSASSDRCAVRCAAGTVGRPIGEALGSAGPSRPDSASARSHDARDVRARRVGRRRAVRPAPARPSTASRTTLIISGVRASVLLMTRFSRFSTDQQNSPISCAPTMRPLPFSVWKGAAHVDQRIAVVRILFPQREQHVEALAFSLASSMNSSRNSGSSSW